MGIWHAVSTTTRRHAGVRHAGTASSRPQSPLPSGSPRICWSGSGSREEEPGCAGWFRRLVTRRQDRGPDRIPDQVGDYPFGGGDMVTRIDRVTMSPGETGAPMVGAELHPGWLSRGVSHICGVPVERAPYSRGFPSPGRSSERTPAIRPKAGGVVEPAGQGGPAPFGGRRLSWPGSQCGGGRAPAL